MRMSDWSSDVCSSDLGDVEPVHFLAGRAGLDRHQRLSQHLGCVLLHLVDRLRQAHAALGVRGRTDELALAATTCMDLRLDDIKRHGEFFGSGSRLFSGEGGIDRKSTRLNSSHSCASRMPSSACKQNRHNNSTTKQTY